MDSRKVSPLPSTSLILIECRPIAIRVEWCKARARAHRWEEEVRLLFEEKKRTLRFLEWHANWWADHTSIMITDQTLSKGYHVYAERQVELRCRIGMSFADMWGNMQHVWDVADGRSVSSLL